MRQDYGEEINRPYRGMVVHVRDGAPRVLLSRRGNAIEMRVNRRRMVMIRSDISMDMLKWRHKKCQHEREAGL